MTHKPTDELACEWRTVKGFDKYQVNALSHVRGPRCTLKPYINPRTGYCTVNLYSRGKLKVARVHRLVLSAFVGDCPKGMVACHNDGNRLNNCLSNLRWDTQKANYEDARRHGTNSVLERHGSAKLDRLKVQRIRELIKEGVSKRKLARDYRVSQKLIQLIAKGEIWRMN